MLTLKVCLDGLRTGNGWDVTAQTINDLTIFDNDLIARSVVVTEDGYEIWVGEASDPGRGAGTDDERIDGTRRHDECDGLRIIGRAGPLGSRITVARTAGGTSPLYVSTSGSRICISWKFEEVVAIIDGPRPNVEICRLVLKHGIGQTREQVIRGVFALWPGESASFDDGGLKFSACDDIDVVLPSTFGDQARATDAFIDAISDVLRPFLTSARRPLLEVSGGMDSTCVAIAAASLRGSLESYGVIQPGAVGRQQRVRRQELVELLGLVDYTGSSASALPIESLLNEECQVTPNDDLYRMCLMNTLHAHDLRDVDLLITGIGGDELSMEHTFCRHDWEVAGHASPSAIVASMGRSDMFMRRGIWTLNPLVRPSVVNLCRAMPAVMRKGRLLNLLTMARAGLSDGYITPRYHENYANVLMLEAIECDFDGFLETSILGDYAIVDVPRLLAKTHRKTQLGVPIKLVGQMYETIRLEMVLRRYVR